ncbi:MAG: T9SS type A sorting domain-containing protein [Melioribacteraceae bacterium]|nr:T9SS type A sorting domain-containing protein [Melioribacteraceae bacterium]
MTMFSSTCNLKSSFAFKILFAIIIFINAEMSAQQLAFPGAEGYGRFTTGGRGGDVYEVINLNDSGPGSLREAINASGPRTIVFRVSGTIELKSNLNIENGDLTIAGQTSPGDGIALRNYTVYVGADNVIIRYLRFRLGDVFAQENDAIWGRYQKNIIIDHCSMSWSTDEAASFYDNENFTMQWCLISESLNRSVHDKGDHGYGGIWGGMGATFHHNLLAHHKSRNPRFQGSRGLSTNNNEIVDFVNNVIYNWGDNSAYGGEGGNQNIRLNYYKYGPATGSLSKQYRIVEPSDEAGNWYVADNYVYNYPDITADNWNGGVQGSNAAAQKVKNITVPFPIAEVSTQDPEEAYLLVLQFAGATLPKRDAVDSRIAEEVMTGSATFGGVYGSGTGIIDSQNEVGGWPVLYSAPAPEDSDHDGMPDNWETANGLTEGDPEDRNGDLDGDGYTNLEEYLNSIIPQNDKYLTPPTNLASELIGTNSISLTWNDNSDNETGFRLERASDSDYIVIAELGANVTAYLDENLPDYTTFKYRVVAFNDSLESAYSSITVLSTESMDPPPSNLTAELIGTNSVRLTWVDNSPIDEGFILERTTGVDYAVIAQLGPGITSYLDENLADYTIYSYRIKTYRDTIHSIYSNVAQISTLSQQAAPTACVNIEPKNQKNYVPAIPVLLWQPGLNVSSHYVYLGTTNPPPFIANVTDTFFISDSLEKGKRYYWRIDEVNDHGTTEGEVWSFTVTRDLPDARIAWWKLDESEGSAIADNGGFGNVGTMVNMPVSPFVQGISDNALLFDGIDDRVIVPNSGLYDFSNEGFTISIWVKVSKYSDNSMYLLSKGSFAPDESQLTNGNWYGFELKGDELRFSIDDNINKSSAVISGAQQILGDRWNNIVGMRDDNDTYLKLYINGWMAGVAQDISGNISNHQDLILGNSFANDTPFNGSLDDIKIFNYALSKEEVINITTEFITENEDESVPETFALNLSNYPNPFNPSTTIVFSIPETGNIKLEVVDLLGRKVATLIDEVKSAGEYSVSFNASSLSSGMYIYTLSTTDNVISSKMLFVK